MKAGIIGCGLIGQKRLQSLKGVEVIALSDTNLSRAKTLSALSPRAQLFEDYKELLNTPGLDFVVVATPHKWLAPITKLALEKGIHVLVEKPAALHAEELPEIMALAERKNLKVHVGFNHRYHRAFRQAKILVEQNDFGKLMFLRGRYGHGGRIGMEKEWRAIPELSGGGELIDQGMHMIDLARFFMGEIATVQGDAQRYFWQMPVDDNAFMNLKSPAGQTAFLHVSCSEWKNTFSMEIYFEKAKLEISGLGGSYGVERLIYYKMLPEMGPPETFIYEYPMADDSWAVENQEFIGDILENRKPAAGLNDAYQALKVVSQIYAQSNLEFLK